MAYLTKYGSFWGSVPDIGGRMFWVAPASTYTLEGQTYSSSDGHDGLSPERALASVAQAITNATDSAGDVIVLLPGAHTAAASLAISKAQVKLIGLGGGSNWVRPRTTLTTSAADEVINVTAADVEIANLRIIAVTAQTAVDFTSAAHRLYIHDCSFDLTATANTATIGIGHPGTTYTTAPANVVISHNYFEVTGAQGPAVKLGDASDFLVEKNVIAFKGGTWAVAMQQFGVLGWGIYRDNDFVCLKNGTITKGITGTDLTSTLSVGILRNSFGGTVTAPIDDWGATDAFVAENYVAQTGGGSGGALWSSIT